MIGQTSLLMEWLEGEGERQRRPFPLPPQVGDSTVRGWVHVVVCVLGGVLTTGLLICWLDRTWLLASQVGTGPAWLAKRRFAVGQPMILKGVRVERIIQDFGADGAWRFQALIVQHRDLSIFCEFGEKNAIRHVRVGDIISIWSTTGPVEEASIPMLLLTDCQIIEAASQPGG